MKRTYLLPAVIGLLSITMYSCKTKKLAVKPAPAPITTETPAPTPPPPSAEPVEKTVEVAKPNFNFSNVLFEFNSSVLKTASLETLDQAATEMKKEPSTKFIINGNSSAEGTEAHNMSLSVDRANAVKSYLVNAGLDAANFTIKGFGALKPVSSNKTEEGRALNRRVEIKVNR